MSNIIIEKAVNHYGKEHQTVVCMEECSELIKECSKMLRGIGNIHHLAEEIADVYICLEMLEEMYEIRSVDLVDWKAKKLIRLSERMESECGKC